MFITSIKNLFRKPVTQLYPYEKYEPFDGYRGKISWEKGKCTFCMKCGRACTSGAIKILIYSGETKEWVWNPIQCIYCGECVRSCPFGALIQEKYYASPITKGEKLDWSEIEKKAGRLEDRWRRQLRDRRGKRKSE